MEFEKGQFTQITKKKSISSFTFSYVFPLTIPFLSHLHHVAAALLSARLKWKSRRDAKNGKCKKCAIETE